MWRFFKNYNSHKNCSGEISIYFVLNLGYDVWVSRRISLVVCVRCQLKRLDTFQTSEREFGRAFVDVSFWSWCLVGVCVFLDNVRDHFHAEVSVEIGHSCVRISARRQCRATLYYEIFASSRCGSCLCVPMSGFHGSTPPVSAPAHTEVVWSPLPARSAFRGAGTFFGV